MTTQAEAESPLERYMRLLELIAAFPDKLALSDIAALSDLPKTTAHRLLKGLVKAELAKGGQGGRAYAIGPRLSRLLHATADDGWIDVICRPLLADLADRSGEACYLTRLVGNRVQVAVAHAPEVRWRSFVQPGIEMPPHASATGKATFAFQTDDIVTAAVSGDLPTFTVNTRNDEAWVRSELETVRKRGYATCIGEIDEGLAAVAVPVRLPDGAVLHALGMTGPLQRVMNDDFSKRVDALRLCAEQLSEKLALGSSMS